MFTSIHVALQIWAFVLCTMGAVIIAAGESLDKVKNKGLFRILTLSGLCSALCILQQYLTVQNWNDISRSYISSLLPVLYAIEVIFTMMVYFNLFKLVDYIFLSDENADMYYDRKWYYISNVIASIGCLIALANMFSPVIGSYEIGEESFFEGPFYNYMSILILCINLIVCLEILAELGRIGENDIMAVLMFCFMPIIGIIIEYSFQTRSLNEFVFSIGTLILFTYHEIIQSKNAGLMEARIEKQKREIEEKNTRLLLSQIQPHFMFNALGSIQYLCKKDPEKAYQATSHFSKYLRSNIRVAGKNELISFDDEMEHVDNYLWLENMRFGDMLKVDYDFEEDEFMLPALTIQPIVENAVRHGLMGWHMGGTVKVSTYSDQEGFYIKVEDDGEGFDPDKVDFKEGNHVGLVNVKSRLDLMCHGSLDIKSAPEEGTVVTIFLPRKYTSLPDSI